MIAPNGENHTIGGVYREIHAPEKLVFTWAWEPGSGCGSSESEATTETLVTVELHEKGSETEVVLTHERLPNVESRGKHSEGWAGC